MDSAWLNKSAKLMREYADGHPWTPGTRIANYRRIAADGFLIEFYVDARTDDYTLAAAREGATPTDDECRAVMVVFGAPMLLTRHLPPRVSELLHIRKFMWKREYAAEKPGHEKAHRPRATVAR